MLAYFFECPARYQEDSQLSGLQHISARFLPFAWNLVSILKASVRAGNSCHFCRQLRGTQRERWPCSGLLLLRSGGARSSVNRGAGEGRRTPEEQEGTRRDETTVWKVCTGAEERVAERSLAQRKRDRQVKATCWGGQKCKGEGSESRGKR